MRHLANGMNAGVGAPGALQVDFGAKELVRDALQVALDTAGVDLRLPARKFGAVVFEGQSEGPHVTAIMRDGRAIWTEVLGKGTPKMRLARLTTPVTGKCRPSLKSSREGFVKYL